MPSLRSDVFAVVSDRDLIILDVRDDAYALLVDALADPASPAALLRPLDVPLSDEAVAELVAAGLVTDARRTPSAPLEQPRAVLRHAPEEIRRPSLRDAADLLAALADCRRRMRKGLPFRNYRGSRAPRRDAPLDVDGALRGLAAARLIIPTPARCLPASLVAAAFLERRGIASEIVFGVRTHPFTAHCWVEVDGALVDDEADRVAAYHPICVATR